MSPHILALDVAGAPHRWINVRDAAHYYATDMIAWAAGTNEFVLRGGTQRSTGLQSMIRASSVSRHGATASNVLRRRPQRRHPRP